MRFRVSRDFLNALRSPSAQPAEQPQPGPEETAEPAMTPASVAPVVVPRWVQLVLLPLALLGLWALARQAPSR
jgi:hypothetical protein